MSEYKHRLTLAVPELLMAEANQLALIAGESANDDKTFTKAGWADEAGNLYAVCSTISKPIVLELLTKGLPVAQESEGIDYALAKQALGKVVVLAEGINATSGSITLAIDIEPMQALEQMGLSLFVKEEVQEELHEELINTTGI